MDEYGEAEALEDIDTLINVFTSLESMQPVIEDPQDIQKTKEWMFLAVKYTFKLWDDTDDIKV